MSTPAGPARPVRRVCAPYTQQYGWIWMPYADAYTQVPANGWGEPYAYVYHPAYSAWTWVAAPWIWGHGPWPVFGVLGPVRFGWYVHGWWRAPYRWHPAPARAWGWYPGGGWRSAPAYARGGGWGTPAPATGGHGGRHGAPRVSRGHGR